MSRRSSGSSSRRSIWTWLFLSALAILLSIWLFATLHFFILLDIDEFGHDVIADDHMKSADVMHAGIIHPISSPKLLSRMVDENGNKYVTITSSARGNLGPAAVLNQNPPGKDWLKDRWQAASDMGGTAIPGSHWVMLDFTFLLDNAYGTGSDEDAVEVTKVVLDWETAYANDYRIEGRLDPPPPPPPKNKLRAEGIENENGWCVLYDGALDKDDANNEKGSVYPHRLVEQYGQSPGVKQKLPLHIIHTIDFTANKDAIKDLGINKGDLVDGRCRILKYMRVFIRRPARGWGVSIWEVDVYGAIVDSKA